MASRTQDAYFAKLGMGVLRAGSCGGQRQSHANRVVPAGYHRVMAMNLRLTDAEAVALRRKATEQGRSMQEVARSAIAEYVSDRPARLRSAIERVRAEDAELLDRLSR